MSKDIWHIADITPDPCRILICKTNKGQNYTAIIPSPQEWNTMILPEFYSLEDIDNAERIEQYAYLDDLLALETELKHTRKAFDVATKCINWVIDTFQKGLEHEADVVGCCELSLERIEEQEQKDVK